MMKITPLIEEIDIACSPEKVFEAFKDEKNSIFLDGGMDHSGQGRYSVIVTDPFMVFRSKGRKITIERSNKAEVLDGHPLTQLKNFLYKYRVKPIPHLPVFTSGAMGYFSYDLGWQLEKLPNVAVDDLGLDDIHLGFYDRSIVFDNLKKKTYIISTGFPCENEKRRKMLALERLNALKSQLTGSIRESSAEEFLPQAEQVIASSFDRASYLSAVKKVKEYIAQGEIYQANLSQRFTSKLNMHPFKMYKKLRTINPAPFASYHNLEGLSIISASPERFLRISGRSVTTRPIKGTRPRGSTLDEDERLKEELLSSKKDKAELIMIVDLERNDIGKVCDYGSIGVRELTHLEKYATVFHLVSTVEGKLHKDKDHIDCIKACFPGGSITGAPKIRAMEILEELEPVKRGIYTGAIGYIGFNEETDLSIVIRTMIVKNGQVYFHAGGGIVADSVPEEEYKEAFDKARALIEALQPKENYSDKKSPLSIGVNR